MYKAPEQGSLSRQSAAKEDPACAGSGRPPREHASPERIGGAILTIWFCALAVSLSFYAPEGYIGLGNYKFLIWQRLSLAFFPPVALCMLPVLRGRIMGVKRDGGERGSGSSPAGGRRSGPYLREGTSRMDMSACPSGDAHGSNTPPLRGGQIRKTNQSCPAACGGVFDSPPIAADLAALGYMLCLTVSFLLSSDRAESLWGTTGWRMGFLTELLFLLCYFAARLLPISRAAAGAVSVLSASGVVLLAVLDGFGIHPLPFMGTDPSFISTIGNVDWYCGYLALTASLAAGLLFAGRGTSKWVRVPGFVLFVLSVLSVIQLIVHGTAAGWLILITGTLALLSGLGGGGMAGRLISRAAEALLVLMALCFLVYLFAFRDSWAAMDAASKLPLIGDRLALLFADDFGNGRGGIWRISWELYRQLPVRQKLFGVGPDAYASYVYQSPRISRLVFAQFGTARLTNAHSELLTVLIDEGAAAAFCFLVFLADSLRVLVRSCRRHRSAITLTALCALVTVSGVSAVTFRTVAVTPFLFMIVGATACSKKRMR